MRVACAIALLTGVACSSDRGIQKEAFLLAGPEVDYSYGNRLSFRTESPGSPILLFRARKDDDVVRYDPSIGSETHETLATWDSATGGVADESQTWSPTRDWHFDAPKLSFRDRKLRAAGRHHLAYGRSFDRAFVAVLSANGWYRRKRGGLIPFLGSWPAWAGGAHFHQVFDYRTGEAVGEPVRIPLSSREGSIRASWTLDNQYVIYNATGSAIAVAATSLPPRDHLASRDGLSPFQPARWGDLIGGLQIRYLDVKGNAFLIRHSNEGGVYVYDGSSREFQEADEDAWESASGVPWDEYDLAAFGRTERKTLEGNEQERPARLSEEQAGETARAFDFYWTRGRLRRFGKKLDTVGGKPERLSLSPKLGMALVFSSDDVGRIYQERYTLPSGDPVGTPLQLPAAISEAPFVRWTPDERYVLLHDLRTGLLYVQDLQVSEFQ